MNQSERPQYYEGQYLGAEDLAAAVDYARTAQARHALGAHTWGIALGFDLVQRPLPGNAVEMVLTPGYGWDGAGRPIVMLAPDKVGLTLFESLQGNTGAAGLRVEVWLSYRELPAHSPGEGFAVCRDDTPYARVVESYRIDLRPDKTIDSHSVVVAGRSLDASAAQAAFKRDGSTLYDESVPYQAFPKDGDATPWPIFVGIVRWLKLGTQAGQLIARTDDDLNLERAQRRYIGVVAETIQAPAGVLRLRDRNNDPDDTTLNFQAPVVKPAAGQTPDNDLVWVEGNLRVVGDARLVAGKLDYRAERGDDNGIPMWLRRTTKTNPTTIALEAVIAAATAVNPDIRFAVSTIKDPAKPEETKEKLTVTADGQVGINAPAPTNTLQVSADAGNTGIRCDSGYVSGAGDNWTSFAYNAYYESGGTWTIPTPARNSVALEMGDTDMRVKTHLHGNQATQWDVRMILKGDTGNVGIGNAAPRARLEVTGGADQFGTAVFAPDPAKGAQLSHVHRDATGDWYIRSAVNTGKVVIQDAGGNVAIGTATPSRTLHVEGLEIHSGGGAGGFSFANRGGTFVEAPTTGERWVWYAQNGNARLWSGSDKLTVGPEGNVGIGTAPSQDRVYVSNSASTRITVDVGNTGYSGLRTKNSLAEYFTGINTGTDRWCVYDNIAQAERMTILPNGNIGIANLNPQVRLEIGTTATSGDLTVHGLARKPNSGQWTVISDERLKTGIQQLTGALDTLLQLRGVRFDWREPEKMGMSRGPHMGLVAQEAEKVLPEWVGTGPDGYKELTLTGFEALAIEALRELNTKCERLEAELTRMREPTRGAVRAPGSAARGRRAAKR